ncbi:MAG: hypothetical protein MJB14_19770 [Spirochaetes bacterium]|nr:hypothetical protein [Spirochaetota bacterium]
MRSLIFIMVLFSCSFFLFSDQFFIDQNILLKGKLIWITQKNLVIQQEDQYYQFDLKILHYGIIDQNTSSIIEYQIVEKQSTENVKLIKFTSTEFFYQKINDPVIQRMDISLIQELLIKGDKITKNKILQNLKKGLQDTSFIKKQDFPLSQNSLPLDYQSDTFYIDFWNTNYHRFKNFKDKVWLLMSIYYEKELNLLKWYVDKGLYFQKNSASYLTELKTLRQEYLTRVKNQMINE